MNLKEILLLQVMEEASEIAQAASKCLRFTPEHHVETAKFSNINQLRVEVRDLITVLHKLGQEFPELEVNTNGVDLNKLSRMEYYHGISKDMGTLNE